MLCYEYVKQFYLVIFVNTCYSTKLLYTIDATESDSLNCSTICVDVRTAE